MNHGDAPEAELTETQQRWLAHLLAAEHSGASLRSYAEAHGLRVQALCDWKQTFKRKGIWPVASAGMTLTRVEVIEADPGAPMVGRERPMSVSAPPTHLPAP